MAGHLEAGLPTRRHFVSFHWCTAVMTFIYLIAAGALVWGERRWVDTVFLILMLIIYAVVSETYGYLTKQETGSFRVR